MSSQQPLGEQKFATIAHCALFYIYHYGEIWSNNRLADEVKNIMNSKTGPGNISWYKVNIKKGSIKIEDYVDTSVEKMGKKIEKPKPEPVQPASTDMVPIPNELLASPESLMRPPSSSQIQTLAMEFYRTRTEKSFSAMYERLKPGMTYHAMSVLKDQSLASDVVNVAFTKIWQKIEQYNPYWCFSTWAYKIVRNESMQLVRREKQFSTLEDANGVDKTDSMRFVEYSNQTSEDHIYNPDYFADEEEDFNKTVYEKVLKQISDLPKTYKEIMVDRELNDMKYKDIAEKYKININSVKTRIKRARMQIIDNNPEYAKIVERRNRSRKNEKAANKKEELSIFDQARLKIEASGDLLDII